MLILETMGLENIVEEESTKRADKTSAKWRTWSTTNSLVVAWLLNSLLPSIAATVETISSAAVSVLSRYMHDPRSGHLDVLYRILRYLKGNPGRGLWFKKNGHLNVDGYSDADWASCLDDRRSTSGYCVFVGGNLVSWRSNSLCLN